MDIRSEHTLGDERFTFRLAFLIKYQFINYTYCTIQLMILSGLQIELMGMLEMIVVCNEKNYSRDE